MPLEFCITNALSMTIFFVDDIRYCFHLDVSDGTGRAQETCGQDLHKEK